MLKIYLPLFSDPPYLQLVKDKLGQEKTKPVLEYANLLEFKGKVSKLAWSIRQLQGKHFRLDDFERNLSASMTKFLNSGLDPKSLSEEEGNWLRNELEALKEARKGDRKVGNTFSVLNLSANSVVGMSAAVGVVIFGMSIATGPIGIALLSAALTLISAVLLAACVYSIYVEGRFLADKQFKEIEDVLDVMVPKQNLALAQNSDLIEEEPHAQDNAFSNTGK